MKSIHFNARITAQVSRITAQVARRTDMGLILAGLLTLFIIQSLLQPGLPTLADLPIHLYRTLEYGQSWGPGVIVPRWAPNLAYGYGYPLFVFAPPLPYWLGLAWHGLGFSLENSFKVLIILTILLYAIGMYLLGRDLWASAQAGLIAATAYAFAPFALREALLYGGNIPQLLAIGLFTWTLWAMTRAAQTRSWVWSTLAAFFYAAILLSHLFQALIFTPVAGLFGLVLYNRGLGVGGQGLVQRLKTRTFPTYHSPFTIHNFPLPLPSPYALITIPLGLLLAAFFWLPAFTERVFTRAQAGIYLTKSPFYVRYPAWTELVAWIQPLDARAANPYVPLTLGVVTLILAGLGLAAGIIRGWGLGTREQHISDPQSPISSPRPPTPSPYLQSSVFFAAIAAAAICMTLSISRPLWETVSILQVAEFPWRMLGLANLGLAFLTGGVALWLPPKGRWPFTLACLGVQIIAVAPLLYPVIGFSRYEPLTVANQVDYERRSQSIGTTTLGEYLPQTVTRPPTGSPLVETFLAEQYPERLDRSTLPARATATLLQQSAVTHIYRLNSPTAFTLRFFQFDYPGWQAQLDDQAALIRPEAETGLMLIQVPAGPHDLLIHFGEIPGRIFAVGLTGLTLIGLIGIAAMSQLMGKGQKSRVNSQQAMVKEQRSMGNGQWSIVNDQWPTINASLSIRSPAPPPARSRLPFAVMAILVAAALWLKPLLQPVFTVHSPPNQALPAQHQTRINFAGGIQLIGYDLDQTVVPAGGRLQLVLYWQTDAAPLKVNLQPFVHLDRLDNLTTVADATNYTPGDVTTESVLPTFHWDNARYVRDEHDLLIPPDTPPLAYAVRIGLLDPHQGGRLLPLADGNGDTAQLTLINVAPPPGSVPRLAQPLEVSFKAGQTMIQLTGFELDSLGPQQLDFKLAWHTDQSPPTNYTVFAQLLDSENNLVANFDRPPLDGAYPTSTWLPGQTIIDPRAIPLQGVPAGEYHLIVGLYDSITRQLLITTTGTDFIELTKVKIGNP